MLKWKGITIEKPGLKPRFIAKKPPVFPKKTAAFLKGGAEDGRVVRTVLISSGSGKKEVCDE